MSEDEKNESGTDEEQESGSDEGQTLTKENEPDSASVGSFEEQTEEEKEQARQDREERLDPDNRPENAEVDNTQRDFDTTTGQFTDHETDEEIGPYGGEDEV